MILEHNWPNALRLKLSSIPARLQLETDFSDRQDAWPRGVLEMGDG